MIIVKRSHHAAFQEKTGVSPIGKITEGNYMSAQ